MIKCKLGELIDVTRGMCLPGEYYSDKGELIRLTLGNFDSDGGFKPNTSKKDIYYTGEVRNEFILNAGDIITPLTEQTYGLLGSTARIPESGKYVQSGDVALIKCKEGKMDDEFCYYLISSDTVKKQLSAAAQQTKIRHTSPDKIKDCTVVIPDIDYQIKAGELLEFITQKIKINKKINAKLEEMAKSIYDYWFLQFDFPDENGNPYKSSSGKMVWNEELKREIPEGWKVEAISKYILIHRGVNYSKGDIVYLHQEDFVPLLRANNIQNGVINYDSMVYVRKTFVSEEQMLDKNSVLITMSSGSKEHLGKTAIIYSSLPCTYGAFCSKISIDQKMRSYLSVFFRSKLFKNHINKMSLGTNINNINNINNEHINSILLPIPPYRVLHKFESIFNDVLDRQGKIHRENQELVSLRDYLLPLLMNGQVGFKED